METYSKTNPASWALVLNAEDECNALLKVGINCLLNVLVNILLGLFVGYWCFGNGGSFENLSPF